MEASGLYRRPLPDEHVAFSSPAGRQLFREALAAGGLESWFPLSEQLHTQSEPAFCGLGSLVVVLNALAIDPGRTWRGPWRWFGEELLTCCLPHDVVRRDGLTIEQVACLARCNGAVVELVRPETPDVLRADLREASLRPGGPFLLAGYDRATLGQTGAGHFSPLGGFHANADRALILDVARFKYPPHWVPVERLWAAMRSPDPATGRPRGYLRLGRDEGAAGVFRLRSEGDTWRAMRAEVPAPATGIATTVEAVGALLGRIPPGLVVESDDPSGATWAELAAAPVTDAVRAALETIGDVRWSDHEVQAALLVLAWPERDVERLGPEVQAHLAGLRDVSKLPPALCREMHRLREQLRGLEELFVA